MLSIDSADDIDSNTNELLIDLKQKQLVDEYTINSTKLTSHKTDKRAKFYSTILSNCSYTIQVTGKVFSIHGFVSLISNNNNMIYIRSTVNFGKQAAILGHL